MNVRSTPGSNTAASNPTGSPFASYQLTRYECWLRSVIFTPLQNAALNTVVETWHTPPPTPFCVRSAAITYPSTNPCASSMPPTVCRNENVPPGGTTAPLISPAATRMFVARSCDDPLNVDVPVPISSLIPSAPRSLLDTVGVSTLPGSAYSRLSLVSACCLIVLITVLAPISNPSADSLSTLTAPLFHAKRAFCAGRLASCAH